ncbi:4-hydroxybenzoate polyprenyltransferase [Streptomyces sp. SceaMP-e96]|uniref:SCO3242 family prenyltransferase n=1 Tax=Streptomyces TaxID=1883 RepID=UPI000823A694|nr:UbiA family prenyltransferase [Streptomyces sp. SceaMP-e96]SCK30841.1 4-hydroxybenzoate polyprenyltransferase [Streptomyces sp. SceaMP-e96]
MRNIPPTGKGTAWPGVVAELLRAPAALTVPGDAIAGAAAVGRRLDLTVAGLAAGSVGLYWGGMALNDFADRELDAWERSHRPIPSGRIRPGAALAVAVVCTAGGLGLTAVAGGRRSLAVAVPLAGLVWAYDLHLKSTVFGPAAMACARGLDVLVGATAHEGTVRDVRAALLPATAVAAHTAAVTWLSRSEVEGAAPALPATILAATAAIATVAAIPPRRGPGRTGRPAQAAAALAGWYGVRFGASLLKAVREPAPERLQEAVAAGIHAMVPLQAAFTARTGAVSRASAVASLFVLARRLGRRVTPT